MPVQSPSPAIWWLVLQWLSHTCSPITLSPTAPSSCRTSVVELDGNSSVSLCRAGINNVLLKTSPRKGLMPLCGQHVLWESWAPVTCGEGSVLGFCHGSDMLAGCSESSPPTPFALSIVSGVWVLLAH